MDFKDQPMTDEYALQYALKQGYLAGRIEMMQLREQIAKDIETLHNECFSFSDCQCTKAAAIARNKSE